MRPHHLLAAASLGLLLAVPLAAQRPGVGPALHYDTATVRTFSGRVLEVRSPAPGGAGAAGVQLLMQVGDDTLPVHLGPRWVLDEQRFTVAPGDQLEVTGSRVLLAGTPAVVAAEVRRARTTLTLRDRSGTPRWIPRGRRRGP